MAAVLPPVGRAVSRGTGRARRLERPCGRNLERGRTGPHSGPLHRLADALELRGEARGQFFAAAGQLACDASAGAAAQPEGRLAVAGAGAEQVVPRQLPGPVRQFVGRDSELAALTALLDRADTTPDAVLISTIGGTAGVGKTALVVRRAHQVAGRFPDGQLYVNLRGYNRDEPLPAADALAAFLRGLPAVPKSSPGQVFAFEPGVKWFMVTAA